VFKKGYPAQDFKPLLFHQTTSSGPLIHDLEFAKIFEYKLVDLYNSGVTVTNVAKTAV
jgi:hypothetical protein